MYAPRQGAETAGEADWTQPTPASLCSLQAGTCCQQCPPVGLQSQLAARCGPTGRMAAMMVMPCHWLHYLGLAPHARRSSTQPAPADMPHQAAMDAAQALVMAAWYGLPASFCTNALLICLYRVVVSHSMAYFIHSTGIGILGVHLTTGEVKPINT